QRFAGRRLIAVHTPHTYSRTRVLLEDYRAAFEDADVVVLGPIEAARERGSHADVSSEDVAARVGEATVVASSLEALAALRSLARSGDVVLVLSLGGFDKLAPRLLAALEGVRAGR
ncbi:MAG TPA: UDP-N-acetylmuramate--L-alanine ligase, partial [Candidatus Dormibacteraeota bacterium]|nr:UDP-N-acetylmuramate--L-alanine ligase [Candidatus Dormibacteraeota bacterium]